MTEDAPDVTTDDLFVAASRMVRDLDAAIESAGVSDLRRRRVSGPVRCDDPSAFRGSTAAAGYVTDGSEPGEILERVREVWEQDGGPVLDLDVDEDRPTIARRDEAGTRHEAAVFTNRSQPLLSIDIQLPCAPIPEGYEDPDQLYERLYDDYLEVVDPDGEQRDAPLDPGP